MYAYSPVVSQDGNIYIVETQPMPGPNGQEEDWHEIYVYVLTEREDGVHKKAVLLWKQCADKKTAQEEHNKLVKLAKEGEVLRLG